MTGVENAFRQSPTLTVIAREAGVSVPTVSKVLNQRADVAAETRRRVSEVLRRRGYVRRVRTTPPLLDVVMTGLGSTYSATILRSVEQAAHEARLEVVVSEVLERTGRDQPAHGWLDRIADRGTSGVLLVLADLNARQRFWLAHHEVPLVVLDPASAQSPDTQTAGATNRLGARQAVEHLTGLGHRRIAIITGRPGRVCGNERLAGYDEAMSAAGLAVPPEYVRRGDFSEAGGCQAVGELFDLDVPPTAVFTCSDRMALGVYQALNERGLRVPEDVSVVGFDDLPEARWVSPALTTIRQPLHEIATAAVHMLLHGHPHRVELPTTLVVRASTARTD